MSSPSLASSLSCLLYACISPLPCLGPIFFHLPMPYVLSMYLMSLHMACAWHDITILSIQGHPEVHHVPPSSPPFPLLACHLSLLIHQCLPSTYLVFSLAILTLPPGRSTSPHGVATATPLSAVSPLPILLRRVMSYMQPICALALSVPRASLSQLPSQLPLRSPFYLLLLSWMALSSPHTSLYSRMLHNGVAKSGN